MGWSSTRPGSLSPCVGPTTCRPREFPRVAWRWRRRTSAATWQNALENTVDDGRNPAPVEVGTLLGINISPWYGIFVDDFPFPQVGYVNFLEGSFSRDSQGFIYIQQVVGIGIFWSINSIMGINRGPTQPVPTPPAENKGSLMIGDGTMMGFITP